jgi:hypothetical protein
LRKRETYICPGGDIPRDNYSLLRTSRVLSEQAERASETKQNTSRDHLNFLDLKVPIQKQEQEVVEG